MEGHVRRLFMRVTRCSPFGGLAFAQQSVHVREGNLYSVAMRETYHDQLAQISDDLGTMTRLVGTAISRATESLLNADLSLAEIVIAEDSAINAVNDQLEERCLDLAALQQPVATDLRVVMSAIRMSSSLERMGDLAAHVAKQTRLRYPSHAIPHELLETFAQMGRVAEAVTTKTGQVIAARNVALAEDIERHDDEMDRLHRELFTIVLDPSWTHGVEAAIDVTLLSRYYERFADHAVTIARRVVHIVTGEPYASVTARP